MKIIRVQKKQDQKKTDRAGILDALAKAAIYVAWAEELKGKTFTPNEKMEIERYVKKIEEYLKKIRAGLK